MGTLQDLGPTASVLGEVEDLACLVRGQSAAAGVAGFGQLFDHGLAADLGEFVERPEHRRAAAREPLRFEKPVEDLAVVERDGEVRHAGPVECGVDDLGDLGIGNHALGTNRVKVALHKLTVDAGSSER